MVGVEGVFFVIHWELTLDFLKSLRLCVEARTTKPSLPINHPLNLALVQAFRDWLEERDSRYVRLEGQLVIVDSHFLPADLATFPQVLWFSRICRTRKINQIAFWSGIETADLNTLVALLCKEKQVFRDNTVAQQILQNAGIHNIKINAPSYEDSFAGPMAFDLDSSISQADHLPPVGREPVVSSRENRHDGDSLTEFVSGMIETGQLPVVANLMTRVRRKLQSSDPQIRKDAFCDYQIIVAQLIKGECHRALYAVVKSIPEDLRRCTHADCYALHLDTFDDLISYFCRCFDFRPALFGLAQIASEKERLQGDMRMFCDEKLQILQQPTFVASVFKTAETKPHLGPYIQGLFGTKIEPIAPHLLRALYATTDGHQRKLILDAFMAAGPTIHGQVLRELGNALDSGKPWYVKRNLLTILANEPPLGLKPLLWKMKVRETEPKLLDLVYRCPADDERSGMCKLGVALLNVEEPSQLIRFMGAAGSSGQTAYVAPLVQIFKKHPEMRVRKEALSALGRIGDESATAFLKEVLSKNPSSATVPIPKFGLLPFPPWPGTLQPSPF